MATKPHGYMTIIGFSLIEPILTLIKTLETAPPKTPNEVQMGRSENGYSAAIVALSVLLLESAINRIRYFERREGRKLTPAEYFKTICRDPELATAVDEIFAVRDVIVHNHVWEAQIVWERGPDRKLDMKFAEPPKLRKGYGDERFKKVMDPVSRLSRHLKLNLFPSRIWRHDAYIVLQTVGQALRALESMDPAYAGLDNESFEFRGREVTFYEVIEEVHKDQRRAR
jgi:hypothetical protein